MTDSIALCRRLFQATESSTRRISVGSAAGVTDDAFSACGACNQAKPSADDSVLPDQDDAFRTCGAGRNASIADVFVVRSARNHPATMPRNIHNSFSEAN